MFVLCEIYDSADTDRQLGVSRYMNEVSYSRSLPPSVAEHSHVGLLVVLVLVSPPVVEHSRGGALGSTRSSVCSFAPLAAAVEVVAGSNLLPLSLLGTKDPLLRDIQRLMWAVVAEIVHG